MKVIHLFFILLIFLLSSCPRDKKDISKWEEMYKTESEYNKGLEIRLDKLSNELNISKNNTELNDTIIVDNKEAEKSTKYAHLIRQKINELHRLNKVFDSIEMIIDTEDEKFTLIKDSIEFQKKELSDNRKKINTSRKRVADSLYSYGMFLFLEGIKEGVPMPKRRKKKFLPDAYNLFFEADRYGHKDANDRMEELDDEFSKYL